VERAKQNAIDDDDFDRAQELTDQMRALRDNAFEQVDIKFLYSVPVSLSNLNTTFTHQL
jgi:hypothetical protein